MNRQSAISLVLILGALAFFGFLLFGGRSGGGQAVRNDEEPAPAQNVSVIDGKQVIDITARGGYSPRKTTAKAGIPTTLRVSTNGSYDCSVAVRIPKLGISKNMEPTGTADIDLGTPSPGTMRGLCGMGMYSFEIDFRA